MLFRSEATKKRIDFLKNFGFNGETTVVAPGINAKMNEFQAAFGLLQLKYVDHAIAKRKNLATQYRHLLKEVSGLSFINDIPDVTHCYSYFPVFIDEEKYGLSRDALYEKLRQHNINGRRYFYPLISQFPAYRDLESASPNKLPVAEKASSQVICLPLYPDLEDEMVRKIVGIIKEGVY